LRAGPASDLEAIRKRLVIIPIPRTEFQAIDYVAAVLVCVVVILATLPVAIPVLVIHDPRIAMALSRGLALLTLFACGSLLGRYSGGSAWKSGASVTAIGVALIFVIRALGGYGGAR